MGKGENTKMDYPNGSTPAERGIRAAKADARKKQYQGTTKTLQCGLRVYWSETLECWVSIPEEN